MKDDIINIAKSLGISLTNDAIKELVHGIAHIQRYEALTQEQIENMIFSYARDNNLL